MAASMSVMAAKIEGPNKVNASRMDVGRFGKLVVRQLARRLEEVGQSVREIRDRDLRRRFVAS